MSLERLKIKKSKYSDTYSKNPILNSLIKQKLQGQIENIRESTIRVIEKNDQKMKKPQSQANNRLIKSLSSLSMNRVKQSLYFDPMMSNLVKDKQAVLFVQSRQLQTPLIQGEKLRSVIQSRAKPEQLQVKMSGRDKYNYEKLTNPKKLQQISKQIKDSVRGISNQLWIPDQPEIEEMFKDPMAQDQYLNKVESDLKNLKQKSHILDSNVHLLTGSQRLGKSSSHVITGIDNQKQKLKPLKVLGYQGPSFEINYNAKRYHKNDYINLQQFLTASLTSQMLTQVTNPSEHLNKCYAIYMSTWKQLVRLTYIQNWQKGLLMEKILWSFIRIIRKVIQTQHSVNYQQFKDQAQLLRQTQQMYEQRMLKLDEVLKQAGAQLKSIKNQQKKLLLTIISYDKVNKQLGQDLDRKTSALDRKHEQLNYIQHKYHNLLNELVQNDLIYNDQKKLYIINKYHQPEMLMSMIHKGADHLSGGQIYVQQQEKKDKKKKDKSPNKNTGKYVGLPQSVKLSFPNVEKAETQQQYEYTRYGKKIKKLQNQLNKYWQKKQDDLQLRLVLQSITDIRVSDMCVETNHRQKIFTQTATQVGQQQQQESFDFQKYLSEKIQQERQYWKAKTDESNNLYISLQQLYEDNQKKIEQITLMNNQQATQLKSLRKTISQTNQNLSNKTAQNYSLHDQIKQLNQSFNFKINELNVKILKLQDQFNTLQAIKIDLEKKFKMQKDDNELLVRRNIEFDIKVKKSQKEKSKILEKIAAVAPWLQKFMESIDNLQEGPLFNLYSDVSKKIQQHLGQFVQKDANVFNLTK